MAAFGTKVVVLMMILPSLLLLQTSSVEAVDIYFYNADDCSGTAVGECSDLEVGECCSATDGATAVGIGNLLSGASAGVYSGPNCTTLASALLASVGTNKIGPTAEACFYNSTFTGANWAYNSAT